MCEDQIYYCTGDLNIDFFQYDVHKPTSANFDTIYVCNVFPLITKPTRVTETTATLIDYRQTSDISHTLVGNQIVDHFIIDLAPGFKMDCAKTTVRQDDKHSSLGFGATYFRDLKVYLNKWYRHCIRSSTVHVMHWHIRSLCHIPFHYNIMSTMVSRNTSLWKILRIYSKWRWDI